HRQPATQFVDRQFVLLPPGLDVGFHQDQRGGLDWLPAEQGRVVLAEDAAGQQPQHQPEVAGQALLPEAEEERPWDQLLEALEWLEHLAKDPNVKPDPLPAPNRDQSGVNTYTRPRRTRPERLRELGLEFGGNLLVGLISAEIGRRIVGLARTRQSDLLHPIPIDQEGRLLARPNQLAQDDGPDADGTAPGHSSADAAGGG